MMLRQLKPVLTGAVFTLFAVAFAYAVPKVMTVEPAGDAVIVQELQQEAAPCLDDGDNTDGDNTDGDNTDGPECVEGSADPLEEEEDDVESEGHNEGHADNHGGVVKIAAHCPVKGRAHGELVRSIAQDKDATKEDAEEACEQALADQGDQDASAKGRPAHAGKGKPDHAGPSKSKGKDDPGDGGGLAEAAGGPPAHSGGGNGKGPGKGR